MTTHAHASFLIFQPFIDAAADRDDTQAPSLVLYKPGTEEVP